MEKVIVKIGLERIDIQEGVTVEALLDSGVIGLVMSSEFARKQEFKLKKIENSIYIRNMDGTFNKKGPIENVILGIPWNLQQERTNRKCNLRNTMAFSPQS